MNGLQRATLCALVDNDGEVELAEAWLQEHASALTHVSEQGGCGCCTINWDIEGPAAVIATLPAALSASSDWTRGGRG